MVLHLWMLVYVTAVVPFFEDPSDHELLQGTWIPASAELGGQPFPEEVRKTIKLTIKDDTYEVLVGKNPDRGTLSLDSEAKPKAMDVVGKEGPNKGKTIPAIYKLDGEKLEICYDLSGKARPQAFKTREGTQLFLVVYEKVKEAK